METKDLNSKKLVQLLFVEPKGVICDWQLDEEEEHGRDFFIPSHIIVGVFDDGYIKAAGLHGIRDINDEPDLEGLFLYDEIRKCVGLELAKAYVAGRMENEGYPKGLTKNHVLFDLEKAGVVITKEARAWLYDV